jgi:hypothetical protein
MRADSRFDKGLVVHKIVEGIRSTGGRFLKKDRASNRWDELTIQATKDKVAHAIRDAVSASALRKSKEDMKPAAVASPQKRPRDSDHVATAASAAAAAAAAYPTSVTSQPQAGESTQQFYQDLQALLPQAETTKPHISTTYVSSQHSQPEAGREDHSHSPIPFHGHSAAVSHAPQMMGMPVFAASPHYAVLQPQYRPNTQRRFPASTMGFQMQNPSLAVAAAHNVATSTFSFRHAEQQSSAEYSTHHPFLAEETTAALHRMIPPTESTAAAHGVTAQFPATGAAPPAQQFYHNLHGAARGAIQEPALPLPPPQQQQHLPAVPAAAGAVAPAGQPTVAQDPGSYDSFIEEINSVLGPLPPEPEDTMDSILKSQQRHHPPRG